MENVKILKFEKKVVIPTFLDFFINQFENESGAYWNYI